MTATTLFLAGFFTGLVVAVFVAAAIYRFRRWNKPEPKEGYTIVNKNGRQHYRALPKRQEQTNV